VKERSWFSKVFVYLYFVVAFGVTGYLIYEISAECRSDWYGLLYEKYENLCYCFCVGCVISVYCCILKWLESRKHKIFAAVGFSVIATGIVYLVNNYWKYLCFNAMFNWESPLNFGYFLKYDLTYSIGLAEFRYPVLFIGVFVLCLACIWFFSKKIFQNFYFFSDIDSDEELSLEYYVGRYMNDMAYQEMQDYMSQMPIDELAKQEVIEAIESYDLEELYEMLFEKYGELLTEEERRYIEERYKKTFG